MQAARSQAFAEEIEGLSAEIAAVLTHAKDATGGPLLAFLAKPDQFSGVVPFVRSILTATLEPGKSSATDLADQASAFGIVAQAAGLDRTKLMSACTRVLAVTEEHVALAHPDIRHRDEWARHWSMMNRVVWRATLFGHQRTQFGDDADWRVALYDSDLEQTTGLRVAVPRDKERNDVVPGPNWAKNATVVDAVRAASTRLDAGDSAVIATDTNGTILYWNEGATSLYGWRSAEVLGRNVLDVTTSSQSATDGEQIMRQLLAGRAWSGKFIVRGKDGAPRRVLVTDVPVKLHGGVVGIVGLSGPAAST